jgi:hypothetical protein
MTYTPLSEDTTIEAERFQFQLLRQAGALSRLALCAKLSRHTRQLCLSGLKRRESDPTIIKQKFAYAILGFKPDFEIWGHEEMWIQDSIELAQQLHFLLESAQILYYVTGGVASSYHGEPRATRVLDIVIQVQEGDIDPLIELLIEQGFYIPKGAVSDVKAGVANSFNITNQKTIANADIMISSNHPFDGSQMQRRELSEEGFYVCTAEDTILQKLRWSRGSLSEKQWRDVQGILRMQGEALDVEYMEFWAGQIEVVDRLEQAMRESGIR